MRKPRPREEKGLPPQAPTEAVTQLELKPSDFCLHQEKELSTPVWILVG